MSSPVPVRVLGVGAGIRLGELRAAAREVGTLVITGVVDPSVAARSRVQAADPGLKVYPDLPAALADGGFDAAVVTSPDDTHRALGQALMEAGLDVLVDKPLATTVADAHALLATARRTGRLLYVGHNMRFMPVVRTLRRVVADGLIGTPRSMWTRHFVGRGGDYFFRDWHCESARTGGLLVHKACHDLDAMCFILGTRIRAVQAIGTNAVYHDCAPLPEGKNAPAVVNDVMHWPPSSLTDVNPAMDVEDLSLMQMVCDDGVLASYQQCHFTPDYWRSYCVIGDAGRAENVGDGPGGEVLVWNRRRHGFDAEPDLRVSLGDPTGASASHDTADSAMLADFVRCLRTGAPPVTDAACAANVVAAGVLARQSLLSDGRLIPVPPTAGGNG